MQLKTFIYLSFLGLFLSFTSCKRIEEKPPISMEKMKKVLLDLQIAETYSVGLNFDTLSPGNKFKKNYDSLSVFYGAVLNHHDLSITDFKEAMKWYENKPVLMDSLVMLTIEQMTEEQARLNIKDYEPEKNERVDPKLIKRKLLINADEMDSTMNALHELEEREK